MICSDHHSSCFVRVVLDVPLDAHFDYCWVKHAAQDVMPTVGQLVRVPFGKRNMTGLVIAVSETTDVPTDRMREVASQCPVPPLPQEWMDLCHFAATYYHRPLGEVAIPCLPKPLRAEKVPTLDRAYAALEKEQSAMVREASATVRPELNPDQEESVQAIGRASGFAPLLLHGVTGSGKTEVYLRAAEEILARHEEATVMILVPEISLTPQLEERIRSRFPGICMAILHSRMSEGERLKNWLSAHTGNARILLGTRMAVMASTPRLDMIIVDEEHDPSYRQQEGLRYSARDLAVWRAWQLRVPVVLGSATPSLESWHHTLSGQYCRRVLPVRAVPDAVLPDVRLVDISRDKGQAGFSLYLLQAIRLRLERGQQSLLFINRRGYAPVLVCDSCGWVSACARCSAYMVFHKAQDRLRCHHCGLERFIPHACPDCGNMDIKPLGRGTQRMEESLQALFPSSRILRIDADSTRRKGSLQSALDQVHRGQIDILVGTQMIAKGHDFRNLTLVGVVSPDNALFSHDYRASERLFAQLMQVGGRAGRRAQENGSEVIIQTRYPHHPLFQAVLSHNYEAFAGRLLAERQESGLPPFIHQALLCAEARKLDDALAFLQSAAAYGKTCDGLIMNEPVPMALVRISNRERAQLLVESASRSTLQAFLKDWTIHLRHTKTKVRWHLEVDPLSI
ncbi:MAG: primosomal protein N' [Burkholderiaceae bacterium]|jgi:primosomal protein N' (replication factor Y)|nr:primosomal protein N' [Burkholderiaceae bacterium]